MSQLSERACRIMKQKTTQQLIKELSDWQVKAACDAMESELEQAVDEAIQAACLRGEMER